MHHQLHHLLHHMQTSYDKISDKIAQNNANYGIRTDDNNRLNTFNIGDVVQKLHACSSDPFQILIKFHDNIYVIDLSIDFSISSTFNIDCLVNYKVLMLSHLLMSLFISLFSRAHSFHHYQIFYPIQHVKLINS